MNDDFVERMAELAKKPKKIGRIVILSGMSGSGKTEIGNILIRDYNYVFIDKYITRPLRNVEIEYIKRGIEIGVKPVKPPYNDGERTEEEQKAFDQSRKKRFLNLRLPMTYVNYDNYYGFSFEKINSYIQNGRNVIIIVNDGGVIQDLKSIYGEICKAYYIHRQNPKDKNIFMELAKKRGDSIESAEKRYEKSIKDFNIYANNIQLYDRIILNTENDFSKIEAMLSEMDHTPMIETKDKNEETENEAKIYVYIGNPGSGKDEALEIDRVQGILHSIIMPKHTDRLRNSDDGEEIISIEDEMYDMASCDLRYTNFGTTYGIITKELEERLEDGISSSVIVSKQEAIDKLKERFPGKIVTIYLHGLSREEYEIEQKDHLSEAYVQRRLEEYDKIDEYYYNNWQEIDHVVINNGNSTDLKLQIDKIKRFYEKGNRGIEETLKYLAKANKYISRFSRDYEGKDEQNQL